MLSAQDAFRYNQGLTSGKYSPERQPVRRHPPPPYYQPPPPLQDFRERAGKLGHEVSDYSGVAANLFPTQANSEGYILVPRALCYRHSELLQKVNRLLEEIDSLRTIGQGSMLLPKDETEELDRLRFQVFGMLDDIERPAKMAVARQAKRDRSCLDGCVVS